MTIRKIFVTGGTGYLGRNLIPALVRRGHEVKALVRPGSEQKLPPECTMVSGNALNGDSFAGQIKPADTFVQLVGVAHPGPGKAQEFQDIDLVSIRESVAAAVGAGVAHFLYVSVAQPAPVMKAYQSVRAEGETLLRASGLNATILRPWYILGPGHWWPSVLLPLYWVCERAPWTRTSARRLGLVTLDQMIQALVQAVQSPPAGVRIVEVPEIRDCVLSP